MGFKFENRTARSHGPARLDCSGSGDGMTAQHHWRTVAHDTVGGTSAGHSEPGEDLPPGEPTECAFLPVLRENHVQCPAAVPKASADLQFPAVCLECAESRLVTRVAQVTVAAEEPAPCD